MDPKLPGLVGFTSNYWSSKGSTCYYWASLAECEVIVGSPGGPLLFCDNFKVVGRETQTTFIYVHMLSPRTSRSLWSTVWKLDIYCEKFLTLQLLPVDSREWKVSGSQFLCCNTEVCFVLFSRAACFLVRSIPSYQGGNKQMLASTRIIAISI